MATANQLEEILNSDVDESKILSLVGSLESKLASPIVRDPSGQNSVTPLNSNHLSNAQIVSSLAHANLQQSPSTVIPNVSIQNKTVNVNGSKISVSHSQLVGINSIVTSTVRTTNATSGTINVNATYAHPSPGGVQANAVKVESNTGYVKQEGIRTVGSTNTGTLPFQNSTNVLRTVVGNNAPRTVNNAQSGSEAIYDLASIAAEQKPLAVKSEAKPVFTSLAPGSTISNVQQPDTKQPGQSFVVNVVSGANAPDKQHVVQTVVKQESNQIHTPGKVHMQPGISQAVAGVKQEVKFVSPYSQQNVVAANQQMVSSHGVLPAGSSSVSNAGVLKSSVISLGSTPTVITRTTKQMSSPQTVAVLRSPASSHTVTMPQQSQTIQIVNLNNSAPRVTMAAGMQLSGAAPKPLAPRLVTASGAQVKIAPQAPQMHTLPVRQAGQAVAGGTNLVLPPNMQLPPGTMLVRNEQGQLMIVSQQQAQTLKVQARPQVPPQTTIAPPQHVISAPTATRTMMAPHATHASAALPRQVVSAAVPRPTIMTPGGHVTHRPIIHQGTPAANQAQLAAGTPAPTSAGGSGTTGNQGILESVKKCKNFLSTLLKLASQSNQPPQTIRNVKELIQGLVDGRVAPELFTDKLQVELKSSPQPYLVPFLKKSLPLLRQSMVMNKMHIDGVRPPPPSANALVASSPMSHPSQQGGMANAVPQMVSKPSGSELTPQLRTIVKQSRPPSSSSGPGRVMAQPVGSMMTQGRLAVSPGSSKVSAASAGHKEKRKYEAIKDDDDINDVATMGGVNLSEETRNILATNSELMAGQLRSCKDENFLHTPALMARIADTAKRFGLDEVPSDVVNLVSHATQERLRTVMEKLAVIAEHRLEIYKTDNNYEVTSEVRQQLKFLEELEKLEQKRKDEAEREVLMRVVKSRSKHEDPEHLKLKEKAKAMQQAELEEARKHEANLTALAAIGPRKKAKLDSALGSSGLASASVGGSSSKTPVNLRPRVKRVNLRDILFLLEQERESNKSTMLYKSFLK